MQRLGSPWLFHRLPIRIPPLGNSQVRYLHRKRLRMNANVPMREKCPTFEISTLLLDLDAENNKYVRDYNEDLDGVPESGQACKERAKLPLGARVERFEALSRTVEENFKALSTDKFNPWHISDHDIMSVALVGLLPNDTATIRDMRPSSVDGHSPENRAQAILNWNAVPLMVRDSAEKTTLYMLRRQQLNNRRLLRLDDHTDDTKGFEEALSKCPTFSDVERLVANTTQTPGGCKIVSLSSGTLALTCHNLVEDVTPSRMLCFINNLVIILKQGRLYIPKCISGDLFVEGLDASLRCRAFGPAQKYLNMCVDVDKQFTSSTVHDITQVLHDSIPLAQIGAPENSLDLDTTSQLLAIYSMLSGQVVGGQAQTPQGSLRDLILLQDHDTLKIYLACLAKLGAFRTMWHLWHQVFSMATRYDGEESRGISIKPELKARSRGMKRIPIGKHSSENGSDIKAFTSGFVEAVQEAVGTNRTGHLVKTPKFSVATGQYQADCQLDIEGIMKSADKFTSQVENSIGEGTNELAPNNEEIMEIFGRPSTQQAMSALQLFIAKNTGLSS